MLFLQWVEMTICYLARKSGHGVGSNSSMDTSSTVAKAISVLAVGFAGRSFDAPPPSSRWYCSRDIPASYATRSWLKPRCARIRLRFISNSRVYWVQSMSALMRSAMVSDNNCATFMWLHICSYLTYLGVEYKG